MALQVRKENHCISRQIVLKFIVQFRKKEKDEKKSERNRTNNFWKANNHLRVEQYTHSLDLRNSEPRNFMIQ